MLRPVFRVNRFARAATQAVTTPITAKPPKPEKPPKIVPEKPGKDSPTVVIPRRPTVVGGGSDPLRASLSLLLVPGADGSAIVDQSPTPKTLTLLGAPTVAGGYFDMSAAGKAIQVASAQQVFQGATALTAEAIFQWPATIAASQCMLNLAGMDFEVYRTAGNALGIWKGVTQATDPTTVTNLVDHHVAISYAQGAGSGSGTVRVFFDGVYVGGWTGAGTAFVFPAGNFNIGVYNGSSEYCRAKCKGVRVTKGAERYPGIAAFTPPTSFPTT